VIAAGEVLVRVQDMHNGGIVRIAIAGEGRRRLCPTWCVPLLS
jgi:hypothetical protein